MNVGCLASSALVQCRWFMWPGSVASRTIKVYDMNRIVRILAAVAVVFAVTAPVIATANVMSQAEKRLETQRKDLVRNWGG